MSVPLVPYQHCGTDSAVLQALQVNDFAGGCMGRENKNLIKTVKNKREALGLSQRRAAELIGISFSTLSRLESEESEPDTNTCARLLNWLGEEAGSLSFGHEKVLEVHFRAQKNIDSKTVSALSEAAQVIKATFSEKK